MYYRNLVNIRVQSEGLPPIERDTCRQYYKKLKPKHAGQFKFFFASPFPSFFSHFIFGCAVWRIQFHIYTFQKFTPGNIYIGLQFLLSCVLLSCVRTILICLTQKIVNYYGNKQEQQRAVKRRARKNECCTYIRMCDFITHSQSIECCVSFF